MDRRIFSWAFFPLYYIPNSHLSSYKLKPQTHNFRMEPIVHSLIVQLIWDSPNLIAMKQASRRALKEKDEIERVSLSKILFGTVSRLVGLLKKPKLISGQDHVLSCYKTEQCRKPARLCRQGYACPFYHNSKDRRRPPAVYKYR